MKIDEACIDHNVALITSDCLSSIYEILNDNSQDNFNRIECLGEIRGILLLADALKEVLRQ